ncbi:hypothetical protein BLA27_24720 [Brucella cytisi]|uniref:Uncharacterized protein n=1 Tax=Brucella cytisi TaxID=407152 RepID=A0A1J6HCE3_9HYPH|nr:hypothetical protein BLA27_24720 [Brucella cytisi]
MSLRKRFRAIASVEQQEAEMKKERPPKIPEQNDPVRPRHEEDQAASKADLRNAHPQTNSLSRDWTRLANILRRACGGFSRARSARHPSTGSKANDT